ncbi:MAG TPA: chromosome segregation protein SMC, partial [Verrucomicrobiae bacterium]|nr:chromosome segregation protein SMC [Verrucomicrobiae bacterium]
MYLKSLQLIGFKSFAEKTTLEFLPGVTAIVGPNGCGKSNIADAIRWVLGEQSAKMLRGSEMADVIFSGTDGRRPINLAEVHMTFAEVDPTLLSLPGVNLDFTEVTITRRVHRDGNGEYFINKTPCRLRDIQSLFMDTGIGRSSYSLMAQGQIDQILSAHPEDRRMIFEEAAGINKYKHQKKEALRKLEYTEANLVRITDIIKEVKRQIISLQRQAGKARRYKELFDQLKALDTRLARHKFDLLRSEISNLDSHITAFATQSDELATQIAGHESQVSDLRRSLSDIDRAISEAVNRDHELKNETGRHQQRIGSNTERIAELEQIIANHHRETAASEEKIHVQEQELTRLNTEFAQIDSVLAAEQAKLRAHQSALAVLDADLSKRTTAADEAKSALIDLESHATRHRNELAALDQKKKYDVIRAERLSTERSQIEEQRRALRQRVETYNNGLTELRAAIASLRDELGRREPELASITHALSAATERRHAAVADVSQKRSRLEVLRQFFGASEGSTTLGSILEVEPQYGSAIEAALSHRLHTVLADDLDSARELLASPEKRFGPGGLKNPSVAAADLVAHHPSPIAHPAEARRAADVVRVQDARFEPLVRSLLAKVVIVDDLDAALAVRAANPQLSIATLRGEFVDEHGILSAVSTSTIREISTLAEEVARLESETAGQTTANEQLEQKRKTLDHEFAELRSDLHAKELALAAKEGELNTLATEDRDIDSKAHTVVFELQGIEQQNTEETQRRAEILDALREAETQAAKLQQQLSAAQRAVDELHAQREQMTQQLTELRINVGGIEHQRKAIEAQREPIAARVRDLRERIQTCATETANHTMKIEQLRTEIVESEQRIGELAIARDQSQQRLGGLQHQQSEVATGIEHAEQELRALRKQASEAQERKSALDLQLAQKRMEVQNLKDRVWQKYQVNVEDMRA